MHNGASIHRPHRLARRVLALSLIAALSEAVAVAAALPADIPRQWPLPHERSAQITPLRARLDAMRLSRPAPAGAQPRVLNVTSCADDDSAGSLRTELELALSGDTLDLSRLTCSTISLSQGALKVELDDLTLIGPGADRLTLDAAGRDRILLHPGSGTLTIEGLTLAHGRFDAVDNDVGFGGCVATGSDLVLRHSVIRDCLAVGVGSYGGAVLSGYLTMSNSTVSGSTAFGDHPTNGTAAYGGGVFAYGVRILDSTISGNSAIGTDNAPLSHWEIGGGLFIARNGGSIERSTISDNFAIRFAGGLTQEGELELRNSTISGNSTAQDDGGGLRVRQSTSIRVINSTISGNHAGSRGGGISFIDNALPSTLISTIVADNQSSFGDDDVYSTMPLPVSGSHNLVMHSAANPQLPADTLGDNPLLLPLADNGGPTRTHALPADSPAIDNGDNPDSRSTDQRGADYLREYNGSADIGAFEKQGIATVSVPLDGLSRAAALILAGLLAISAGLRRRRERQSSN
ncbi:MAG: right-handed parallel beta-helix repeat-containing protein [Xanthomonadales bacterium]|nr:right-handed parallel beta-helix repeat-containing protein [Xanthomonadales bacterium]